MSARNGSSFVLVLFLLLPACGPSFYGQVQPKTETWQVTQTRPPAVSKKTQQEASPVQSPPQIVTWKDITIERTLRAEIEERYGVGESSGDRVLYHIDSIPASISFSEDDTVQSVQITPPVQMDETDLLAAYGDADWERRSDDFLRIWEYDQKGMTVGFAPDDTLVASVEYRAPEPLVGEKERLASKVLVPFRPALKDVEKSLARVQTALTQSGKAFAWVGANQEYTQAQQTYSLIHRKWPIVTDRDMQRYLNGVMDRLTSVTPKPPFPWTIRVVDATTLNAMNLGGGIILINSGLFKHLDSEAQLAYVVAHEMGHQIKRHLASIQSKQQFAQLLIGAAALVTAGAGHPDAARAINQIGSLAAGATLASFSRAQELEADEIGLHILRAAEYDTREAEKVMEKFIELEGLHGRSIPLFATHPDPRERLSHVQNWRGSHSVDDENEQRLLTTHEFAEFKELYRY